MDGGGRGRALPAPRLVRGGYLTGVYVVNSGELAVKVLRPSLPDLPLGRFLALKQECQGEKKREKRARGKFNVNII